MIIVTMRENSLAWLITTADKYKLTLEEAITNPKLVKVAKRVRYGERVRVAIHNNRLETKLI